MQRGSHLAVLAGLFLSASSSLAQAPKKSVEFNRDIRPIFSEYCYACHGPDSAKRKGDLRLDVADGLYDDRGGHVVLARGKPEQSELFKRITRQGKGQMPPLSSGKTLSPAQVQLLKTWIEQGAEYQKHWAFIPPTRPAVPRGQDHPIDAFLAARLEKENLRFSPEADRRTLIRRLYFDLLGLPPTPREVEDFLADKDPQAYPRLVKKLLENKHFGERLAQYWLDVVRYADTIGFHSDNHRDIAPYRDYVIEAFNSNKPFDKFVLEQLAGDLLRDSTPEQKIASGFNRLLLTTEEGGAQPKEYMAKYAADRVRNTAAIFLGITLGCCECHNHKFDPFTIKDFYSFAAFFADIQEPAVGRQPQVKVPTSQQLREIERLDREMEALRAEINRKAAGLGKERQAWEKQLAAEVAAGKLAWQIIKPGKSSATGGLTLTAQPDQSLLAGGSDPARSIYTIELPLEAGKYTGIRLEALLHPGFPNGGLTRGNGNFVLTGFELELRNKGERKGKPVKIASALADFSQEGFPVAHAIDDKPGTGWAVSGHTRRENRLAAFIFASPVEAGAGAVLTVRMKHESIYPQHNIGRFRLSLTSAPKPTLNEKSGLPAAVVVALQTEPAKRSAAQNELLARHFADQAPALTVERQKLAALQADRQRVVDSAPETLITVSGTPRVMRILPRGNWLDESGPVVQPDVPTSLPALGVQGRRPTRLDLAKWIVARDNPLPARVFVNRLWSLFFGNGIVRTMDDFGSQGTWPAHPELLDWLAVEFVEKGWDIKHVIRLMVESRAYRQVSLETPQLRQKDPYNLLLARQARFRLPAEMIRDNALAVSGLLVPKIGGKSVKPYQPEGYWDHLNFPRRTWQKSTGEDQYRRGLYTYWCRTFPHPSLIAFDAPSREECTVERVRSNTPQQALVLLNDPTYVEAARVLAARILREGGKDFASRLKFAYREVLARSPREAEVKVLEPLLEKHRGEYSKDLASARALLAVGDSPAPKDADPVELAAWTSIARVLLNLHETITRN